MFTQTAPDFSQLPKVNAASSGTSKGVGAATGFSVFNDAIAAYSAYNTQQHNFKMQELTFNHNKSMALENLKVNQFIVGRNKVKLLNASAEKAVGIQIQALQEQASTEVQQAAVGQLGGSAQDVLYDISRRAEQAESARVTELDDVLFQNNLQAFQAETQAQDVVGIRPINATSAAIQVGAFAAETSKTFGSLYKDLRET